jgi:hypothetical protein
MKDEYTEALDIAQSWINLLEGEHIIIPAPEISRRQILLVSRAMFALHKEYLELLEIAQPAARLDTERLNFMARFIVEGTWPGGERGGRIAWLADVECLRETIDEAMSQYVSERRSL